MSASTPRLIADIGGTNARFALLDGPASDGSGWRDELVLRCADYPDVVSAIEYYLSSVGAARGPTRPIEGALAIAGPITGDIVRMTNHAWQFSAARTREALAWRRLIMLNDFTALAMAIRNLPRADLEQIGGGQAVPGMPLALLGPGTGLGVSGLIPAGEHWIPLQGEGGHQTLPVMNEREMAVLGQLHQRFSHVSAERVLSGPGLVNLYDALCGLEGTVPEVLTPPEITRRAREASCRTCLEAVSMFCALLGTLAGNLVLTLGAVGGCYIGGGIVPSLGAAFASSHFRDRFVDKGRYADYLSRVPTYVIKTELPAFVGLATAFTAPGPRWEAE
ncbi:MAG TPA: glucokinase [Steroidobacteraceae bacterium]|nr:glucokinase [Steroidobacteraceae bacterium]